jgi:hypothetical protein
MTEAKWLFCTDPQKMLEFLRDRASERKMRLFTVACARLVWDKITWHSLREGLETAERCADGWVSIEELLAGNREASPVTSVQQAGPIIIADSFSQVSAEEFSVFALCICTKLSTRGLNDLSHVALWHQGDPLTVLYQPNLLLDIFGNPFRPVSLDPSWLTWNNATIPKMAQVIYEDRELPSGHLDNSRLAILADALEDAGCTDPDILGHCRGPASHVRACWPVDLILGKG